MMPNAEAERARALRIEVAIAAFRQNYCGVEHSEPPHTTIMAADSRRFNGTAAAPFHSSLADMPIDNQLSVLSGSANKRLTPESPTSAAAGISLYRPLVILARPAVDEKPAPTQRDTAVAVSSSLLALSLQEKLMGLLPAGGEAATLAALGCAVKQLAGGAAYSTSHSTTYRHAGSGRGPVPTAEWRTSFADDHDDEVAAWRDLRQAGAPLTTSGWRAQK